MENLAIGYSVNGAASAAATFGVKGSAGLSEVLFTSEEYGGYLYHYANAEGTGNTGVQGGVSLEIEANFFVAYFDGEERARDPKSFGGTVDSRELSADIKTPVGGAGLTLGGFKSGEWKGVYVGGDVGVGGQVTLLSYGQGYGEPVLLNNEVPTAQRSKLDRAINLSPSASLRFGQAVIQYAAHPSKTLKIGYKKRSVAVKAVF